MTLRAFGLNCTLTATPEASSTQKLLDQVLRALGKHEIATASVRAVDFDIKPGVKADEGDDDAWPRLRQRVLDSNILVLATPIWMGQPSSVAKRVIERLSAFTDEIDKRGRYPTFGRVAIVAVVGHEDGAHHVCLVLGQALVELGFTLPGASPPYWVGEAMGDINYKDLGRTPKKVAATIKTIASNAAHLAKVLHKQPYPAPL